jgi:hypothetical protein
VLPELDPELELPELDPELELPGTDPDELPAPELPELEAPLDDPWLDPPDEESMAADASELDLATEPSSSSELRAASRELDPPELVAPPVESPKGAVDGPGLHAVDSATMMADA